MKRVVILGGGFGGVRCALDLERSLGGEASITLIDRNGYHLFTPALYEVAAACQTAADPFALELRKTVAIPYGEIFTDSSIELIQAQIASADMDQKHVALDSGARIDFDYLVLALGSQVADFGIPGVYEYAHQFKTTDDGVAVNQKLETLFSGAAGGTVPLPIKILVIGAGFAGVELAAELVSCSRVLQAEYDLPKRSFSVSLFEAGPHILPMIEEKERREIGKRLTHLGVIIMENSVIEAVYSDAVKLKTGQTISGNAVIWTAGVQANKLAAAIHGLILTPRGKVIVDEYLRVKNGDMVFALGDIAEQIDPKTQKPVPGLAYVAQAQGSVVAHNIRAHMRGKKLRAYIPEYRSWIAPLGGKFAVAHIGNTATVSGRMGWLARNLVDLRYFLSILPMKKALNLFRKDIMLFSKND